MEPGVPTHYCIRDLYEKRRYHNNILQKNKKAVLLQGNLAIPL